MPIDFYIPQYRYQYLERLKVLRPGWNLSSKSKKVLKAIYISVMKEKR